MKKYHAEIKENIFINAENKLDAEKRIKKYYENLGLYNIDVQIKVN